jgi:hypothetical protein
LTFTVEIILSDLLFYQFKLSDQLSTAEIENRMKSVCFSTVANLNPYNHQIQRIHARQNKGKIRESNHIELKDQVHKNSTNRQIL